jgi:phospholipid/cholesterol/gamma-HCH transport system substrate-binding protein
MKIDGKYAPLPESTRAVVRQASQSGYANRYIELQLPPGPKKGQPTIKNGGTLPDSHTVATVDIDQLFNTLDPSTRKALQDFLKGSAAQYRGVTKQGNLALHYLNPALATSSRLFNELNRDTPVLQHFLKDSGDLVTAVADWQVGDTFVTDGRLRWRILDIVEDVEELEPYAGAFVVEPVRGSGVESPNRTDGSAPAHP